MDSKILRTLSYGVYIVTTLDGTRPVGCTANSIMQVTSSPATLAVSINHDNYTNSCIRKSGKLAVSILGNDSQPLIIGTFGFKSCRDNDKFAKIDYETHDDLPAIKDSCGYITGKVVNSIETETHTVFLVEMTDGDFFKPTETPMTYAYYHAVIKGKSPKNAPTYEAPEAKTEKPAQVAKKARYRCKVCGYIYDLPEDFESLPDTWKCPVCGQPKSVFEKID